MSTRTFTGYGGDGPAPQKTLTAAYTISTAENNIEYVFNAAAGAAVTLPAPVAGLSFQFTTGAAFATTPWTIVTNGSANIINGSVEVAGAVVVAGSEDLITFAAGAETIGDKVQLSSDGTSWFLSGSAALSGGITVAAT